MNLRTLCSTLLLAVVSGAATTHAQIYTWAYVNPSNHSQGVYQTSTLCPGGAGVSAVPNANLSSLNLTQAYLLNTDLSNADLYSATLTTADLQGSNLSNANLSSAHLRSTILTSAILQTRRSRGRISRLRISLPSSFTVPPATRRGTCRASEWKATI